MRVTHAELTHVHFLLAELDAELEALAGRDEAIQALAQLDEREAAGEPLLVVCGKSLRETLAREVAASPVTIARRKLTEMHRAIAPTVEGARSLAEATPVVVELAAHRKPKPNAAETPRSRAPLRRIAHAAALAIALGIVAVPGAGLVLERHPTQLAASDVPARTDALRLAAADHH